MHSLRRSASFVSDMDGEAILLLSAVERRSVSSPALPSQSATTSAITAPSSTLPVAFPVKAAAKASSASPSVTSGGTRDRSADVCHRCGLKGHWAPDCPSKKLNANAKSFFNMSVVIL